MRLKAQISVTRHARNKSTANRLLLGLCILLILVGAGILAIRFLLLHDVPLRPIALQALPVYPQAEDMNIPSEATDLYERMAGGKAVYDHLGRLTFTTHDEPSAVLDFYMRELRNDGWELFEYTGGPKLIEYVDGDTRNWRRFGWPNRRQDPRIRPAYTIDVMALPSERVNMKGTINVSVTLDDTGRYYGK